MGSKHPLKAQLLDYNKICPPVIIPIAKTSVITAWIIKAFFSSLSIVFNTSFHFPLYLVSTFVIFFMNRLYLSVINRKLKPT